MPNTAASPSRISAIMRLFLTLSAMTPAKGVSRMRGKMIMDSMESLIMDSFSEDEFDLKVVERVNELNDKARDLSEELERLVTVEELVNELDQDEDQIRETIRLSGNAIPYIKECADSEK